MSQNELAVNTGRGLSGTQKRSVVSGRATQKRAVPKRTDQRGIKFTDLAISFLKTAGISFGDKMTAETFDTWLLENDHIDDIPEVGSARRKGHLVARNEMRERINKGALSVDMPVDKQFQLVVDVPGVYSFQRPTDQLSAALKDLGSQISTAIDAKLRVIENLMPEESTLTELSAVKRFELKNSIKEVRRADNRFQFNLQDLDLGMKDLERQVSELRQRKEVCSEVIHKLEELKR